MKRYCQSLLLAVVLVAFGTGCNEDVAPETPSLKVEQKDFWFTEDGGIQNLTIESNTEWSISTEADWMQIVPANGKGNMVCEVLVDSSYLYENRKNFIKIQMGVGASTQIDIEQSGYRKQINIKETKIEVPDYAPYGESKVDIEVRANVPFSILLPENTNWVAPKNYKQNEIISIPRATSVRFEYEINDTEFARDAQFKFIAAEDNVEPAILEFKQLAPEAITIGRAGDSLAVLAIVRNIGATINWDISRNMKHWPCVELNSKGRVKSINLVTYSTYRTIPYQVKYLTELEEFYVMGNVNSFLKRIHMGPEICGLKKLKKLSLIAYGFVSMPDEIINMESLEYLDMSSNNFWTVPVEQLRALIKKHDKLRHVNFSANRRWDGINDLSSTTKDSIGMGGRMPIELFSQDFDSLQTIRLSYNYFDGDLPLDSELRTPGRTEIMPKLKLFTANLNRLSGEIPNWILDHPSLCDWDPFVLLFTQEGVGPMHTHDPNSPDCSVTHIGTPEHIQALHSGDPKVRVAHRAYFTNEPRTLPCFRGE